MCWLNSYVSSGNNSQKNKTHIDKDIGSVFERKQQPILYAVKVQGAVLMCMNPLTGIDTVVNSNDISVAKLFSSCSFVREFRIWVVMSGHKCICLEITRFHRLGY